jgi:hypothetical protein
VVNGVRRHAEPLRDNDHPQLYCYYYYYYFHVIFFPSRVGTPNPTYVRLCPC